MVTFKRMKLKNENHTVSAYLVQLFDNHTTTKLNLTPSAKLKTVIGVLQHLIDNSSLQIKNDKNHLSATRRCYSIEYRICKQFKTKYGNILWYVVVLVKCVIMLLT